MIKILLKAFILVLIILSIYFIVNPSACSNLMSGKVVNSMEELPTFVPKEQNHNELLTPTGDHPLRTEEKPAENVTTPSDASKELSIQPAIVSDTNSMQPNATPAATDTAAYSVAEMDYAIASRYVELENEYIKQKKDMKKAAQEISYIVMDDFEMTPAEWEAFLQRATVDNLFEKVRQQQAAK